MPEMTEWISAISSVSNFFSSIFSLFTYFAVAYGLYCMAQSMGLKNPFLAWIPYCQTYTLGAAADEYYRRNEGKTTTYRKKTLGWQIAVSAVAVLLVVVLMIYFVVLLVCGLPLGDYTADNVMAPEVGMEAFEATVPILVILLVILLVFLAVAVVYSVYYYISLHKVFKLFAPEHATGYLVLAILVPLATPILFLVLSKKQPVFTDVVDTDKGEQNYYTL
ncbi:MAG: hypothetical protein IJX72_02120 [Clostridia bacterium]|nr:hypothetical protein [Clostridia bacterium]